MLTTSPTLLDRLRQPDDRAAWERFAALYTPVLERWARRQGLHEADAADLVQEVLLKLIRVLPTYERRTGRTFRGWLGTVTANACRDFRRRRATRPLPGSDGLSGVGEPPVVDLEEAEYRSTLVQRALDLIRPDFEPRTLDIFARLVTNGQSAGEVAADLGIEPVAVYKVKNRVMTRLRQELAGLLD
jgi:RNA polymerase sigma-70 factor (ECF subfamily)